VKVIIKGVQPYDGEYTLDFGQFSNGEYRRIKKMSGYTVAEFPQALKRIDTDFITALGAVAAAREHGLVEEEVFWNAQAGNISLDFSDEEVEEEGGVADPPTIPDPAMPSTRSGESSRTVSELPSVKSQLATGTHT
jgi:hypothetical protein